MVLDMFTIYKNNRLRTILSACLIIIIVLAVFLPSLKNGFVNWDDDKYVTENKVIRSISPKNISSVFTSFFAGHFQPVTILSFLLEYHLFKLNPFGYHLTNLILHLLNCLLLFWLIFILTGKISIAWITAIFFGIHPLQVESVAWISEKKNVLYAFFFLGAMICYFYYLKKDKALKYYYFTLFLFILSLLSKSMAVTMPLVLLSLDYFTRRKIDKNMFFEKIPYFILSLIFGVIAIFGVYSARALRNEAFYGLLDRLMIASYGVIFYLNKIFFPIKLSCLYPYSGIKNIAVYSYSFGVVIILLIALIISGRFTRKIIFASSFFLITIIPALQFIPNGEIIVADRYVYLSSIGIFYILAEGFVWLYNRRIKYFWFIRQVFLLIVLTVIIEILFFLSWDRIIVWKNSISLWTDAIDKNPKITSNAYNNLGEAYNTNRKYEKAIIVLEKSIKNDPLNVRVYINLGNSYSYLGKNQEAINYYKKAIEIDKNFKVAYFNIGNAYSYLGKNQEAINYYKKAIEIDRYFAKAYSNLGITYMRLDRKEEAVLMFKRTIQINPNFITAYINLINFYKTSGWENEIESLYKQAIANNLDYFDAYYYIGNLYVDIQRDKDAILLYKRAVKIKPDSKEAYLGLGNAYLTVGQNKEAIICLEKALKLDPHLAVVHNNIALAYYYANNYNLAIKHCDQAIRLGYAVNPKLLDLLKLKRK